MSKINKSGLPYVNKLAWVTWAILMIIIILTTLLTTIGSDNVLLYNIGIISFFVIVNSLMIMFSVISVPENEVWNYSFFGKFAISYGAGAHLPFPFLLKGDKKVSFRQEKLPLFTDKSELIDFDGGVSAHVKGVIMFEIVDPVIWNYSSSDPYGLMLSKMQGYARRFLENMTYENAETDKSKISLETVLMYVNPDSSIIDYRSCDAFLEIKNEFGIIMKDLIILDFDLSENDKKIREEKFEAENRYKIAVINKQTSTTNAEAKKIADIKNSEAKKQDRVLEAEANFIALEKAGLGYEAQVNALMKVMTRKDAIEYLKHYDKWVLGLSDKAVIIEGSEGATSKGAKFGAGMNTTRQQP